MAEMESRTTLLAGARGVQIHLSELGSPDAARTLVIVHGYGEHSGRYFDAAQQLVKAGYRVILPDMRGHGRSEGPRGYTERFDDYVADLEMVMAHARVDPASTAVFGHSNGGLIVSRWLCAGTTKARCAVLTSPLLGLGIKPPAWKELAGRALSRLWPTMSLPSEIDAKVLTHDAAQVARYESDPLVHHVANARWFTEAVQAAELSQRQAGRVAIPVLLIQAGDDRLVDPAASRRWATNCPGCEFEIVDGAFHELLFETDGQRHLDRVMTWLDSQFGAP